MSNAHSIVRPAMTDLSFATMSTAVQASGALIVAAMQATATVVRVKSEARDMGKLRRCGDLSQGCVPALSDYCKATSVPLYGAIAAKMRDRGRDRQQSGEESQDEQVRRVVGDGIDPGARERRLRSGKHQDREPMPAKALRHVEMRPPCRCHLH